MEWPSAAKGRGFVSTREDVGDSWRIAVPHLLPGQRWLVELAKTLEMLHLLN
jgi:hypothetical protein